MKLSPTAEKLFKERRLGIFFFFLYEEVKQGEGESRVKLKVYFSNEEVKKKVLKKITTISIFFFLISTFFPFPILFIPQTPYPF